MFINEYNPFESEIKGKYLELFEAVEQACRQSISNSAFLINDSSVAYITLHFLTSYEKEQTISVVRTVYVCSTGLGVTSLIQQRVSEEIENIEIAEFVSVLNAQEVIEKSNPDLVISIFPIETDRPFVKVHPIPTEKDLSAIKVETKKILQRVNKKYPRRKQKKELQNDETLEPLSRDIIVKGYIVYEKLLELFGQHMSSDYREAFLLHVLLMVHRIIFNHQYENEGNVATNELLVNQEIVKEIEILFAENDLSVNRAEISALLRYNFGGIEHGLIE